MVNAFYSPPMAALGMHWHGQCNTRMGSYFGRDTSKQCCTEVMEINIFTYCIGGREIALQGLSFWMSTMICCMTLLMKRAQMNYRSVHPSQTSKWTCQCQHMPTTLA